MSAFIRSIASTTISWSRWSARRAPFFTTMMRENLPASTAIAADFTFVNDRLAAHYDLPRVSGSAVQRVPLPKGSPFGGLLTQAAMLKVTANGTTTSPVLRGAWIMEQLIGQPPPPPPPSVPAVEPDIRGAKTIRELLAMHTEPKNCAGCHAKFDPVGLALENFDIMGCWRDRYRGMERRRTGHRHRSRRTPLMPTSSASPSRRAGKLPTAETFRDIHEMKRLLAANPRQLARNLLHQFTLYATGTPVRFSDRAEIEAMLDACAADGYRVRDLVHALVQSSIFLGSEIVTMNTTHISTPIPRRALPARPQASRWRCRAWNA